eukprot:1145431-Pelagomonas_calceolata.AAC.7
MEKSPVSPQELHEGTAWVLQQKRAKLAYKRVRLCISRSGPNPPPKEWPSPKRGHSQKKILCISLLH